MDINTPKQRSWMLRACKITLAICVILGGGTYTEPTRAQWITEDPLAIGNSLIEYGKELERWYATADQYAKTLAFWNEQLVQIKSLQFKLFTIEQQFPELPADYGVKEACPGATGGVVGEISSALKGLTDISNQDVTAQQQNVCVLIEMTQNKKYESTRLYLLQLDAQTTALNALAQLRVLKVLESPGKLSSYQADTGKYTADMMQARETWKTNQEQLDAQIDMLKRRQTILARQALDGDPTTLGTIVNMISLKAAFQ